ncbi:MAG TPA: hypothetical protein VIF60_15090 [Burkholderiaceae bacterium]|jgi:hypothetical protein
MRKVFQQRKGGHMSGSAGLTAQIALTASMLGFCYLFSPAFVGAGVGVGLGESGIMRSGIEAHEKIFAVGNAGYGAVPVVCRQCSGGAAPVADTALPASHTAADAAETCDFAMMASLPMPERHWCMAEAFNAAMDRKKLSPKT